jgi:hypothetical protein
MRAFAEVRVRRRTPERAERFFAEHGTIAKPDVRAILLVHACYFA